MAAQAQQLDAPGGEFAPDGCRINVVAAQDVAHRRVINVMPQI